MSFNTAYNVISHVHSELIKKCNLNDYYEVFINLDIKQVVLYNSDIFTLKGEDGLCIVDKDILENVHKRHLVDGRVKHSIMTFIHQNHLMNEEVSDHDVIHEKKATEEVSLIEIIKEISHDMYYESQDENFVDKMNENFAHRLSPYGLSGRIIADSSKVHDRDITIDDILIRRL